MSKVAAIPTMIPKQPSPHLRRKKTREAKQKLAGSTNRVSTYAAIRPTVVRARQAGILHLWRGENGWYRRTAWTAASSPNVNCMNGTMKKAAYAK